MYGRASWVLIDDVRRLPLKAAEVYRRLTGKARHAENPLDSFAS
jgi:hypothetical protein